MSVRQAVCINRVLRHDSNADRVSLQITTRTGYSFSSLRLPRSLIGKRQSSIFTATSISYLSFSRTGTVFEVTFELKGIDDLT